MAKDLLKKNLYYILDVAEEASEKEIIRAYRKKALKCHPDKNPDNPNAAEQFHLISNALEILTDAAARAAYDQSRKAKKAVEKRNQELDSKRKKFKEDLEAKEQRAAEQEQRVNAADAEKKLQAEIERLRKEGSRLLEEEQRRLIKELKQSKSQGATSTNTSNSIFSNAGIPRMKIKWKAKNGDPLNGGYSDKLLTDILSCYGKINTLHVSNTRTGSAIVEFEESGVSGDILDETGISENPFNIAWLSGKPSKSSQAHPVPKYNGNEKAGSESVGSFDWTGASSGVFFDTSDSRDHMSSTGNKEAEDSAKDFESLVLMRMRQAEERKKLMEQMRQEDEEDG